jgi:hypothetical protein
MPNIKWKMEFAAGLLRRRLEDGSVERLDPRSSILYLLSSI